MGVNKLKKLSEIANISLGAILNRKKAKTEKEIVATYKLFSMKSYEDNLEKNKYENFFSNSTLAEKTVKEGDLIFRLLYPIKVAYVTKELEGLLVPSQYCILQIKTNEYNTMFIKWYLESEQVDKQISPDLMNTVMPLITVNSTKEILIPEINIEKQTSIGKIVTNWEQERKLIKEWQKEQEKYYNEVIKNAIGRQ